MVENKGCSNLSLLIDLIGNNDTNLRKVDFSCNFFLPVFVFYVSGPKTQCFNLTA